MLQNLTKLPIFGPVVAAWLQIAFLVVSAVIDSEVRNGGSKGAEKKTQAIASINSQIEAPGGPEWPVWLPASSRPIIVGFILDLFVFAANKLGFSTQSKPG